MQKWRVLLIVNQSLFFWHKVIYQWGVGICILNHVNQVIWILLHAPCQDTFLIIMTESFAKPGVPITLMGTGIMVCATNLWSVRQVPTPDPEPVYTAAPPAHTFYDLMKNRHLAPDWTGEYRSVILAVKLDSNWQQSNGSLQDNRSVRII